MRKLNIKAKLVLAVILGIFISIIVIFYRYNLSNTKVDTEVGNINIEGAAMHKNITSSTSSSLSSSSTSIESISNETNYKSWIAYWDQQNALKTLHSSNKISSISPSIYALNPDGSIKLKSQLNQDLIRYANEYNIEIIPSISNSDSNALSVILNSNDLTNKNIEMIVTEVTQKQYDGFDIDFEAINAQDRDAFSSYLLKLSNALHAQNKKLTVAILWKADPAEILEGFSDSRAAQDWKAIGNCVDEFRIMAYDYTHSYNTEGPIAPDYWIEEIIKYAISQVQVNKIVLGLPLYAYEWTQGVEGAKALLWTDIQNLKIQYPQSIISDEIVKGENKLIYNSEEGNKVIWYQDAQVTDQRTLLANSYGIYDIVFWRLGGEDPNIFQ